MRIEKERQDRDLQIARQIQQSLFPPDAAAGRGFELAAISRSCYEVGGDYYDFIPLDGGRLAMVIADVSGKGTPASIMMASVHASLQAMAGTAPPTQLLERLNRFLYENTQASRYVTLFYGELDPERRTLIYVNAGHVPPYLLRADGREERLRVGGPVIGLLEDEPRGRRGRVRARRPAGRRDRRRHRGARRRRRGVRRPAGHGDAGRGGPGRAGLRSTRSWRRSTRGRAPPAAPTI